MRCVVFDQNKMKVKVWFLWINKSLSYSQLYRERFRNAIGAFRVSEEKVHSFLWVFILQKAEFSTLPCVS